MKKGMKYGKLRSICEAVNDASTNYEEIDEYATKLRIGLNVRRNYMNRYRV